MKIPLLDLKAQYATIKEDVLSHINDVLDSQYCIGGEKVVALEKKIAEMCGSKYAIGVSSGTDAILNSLMSLDIGYGDEVITATFTFFATAGCIHRVGAKPVFVDIDPVSFNIDPKQIEEKITDKTKAIIPVHLYGQSADMDAIMAIAKKHNLFVIEDGAQAITAEYKGQKVGTFGDAGCFSFFPSKNLGGVGDGGMIVTNDKDLYDRLMVMRNHGMNPKYYHKYVGGNFRLDAIQAAALLVKADLIDDWSEGRRKNAKKYNELLKDVAEVQTPIISEGNVSIVNQYVLRVQNRDELLKHLQSKDIGCDIYYPIPMHLQECFAYLGHKTGDFPVAEKAANEVLAIPIYPELTDDMIKYVAETIRAFYK